MNVKYPPWAILQNQIPVLVDKIAFARELGKEANVKFDLLDLYDKVDSKLANLKSLIDSNGFSTKYASHLAKDLDHLSGAFPSGYGSDRKPIKLQEEAKQTQKNQQERLQPKIEEALAKFISTFDFFAKLDFLNRDLVIIGSNGSGKTSLAKHFTTHIKNNGILVSAQRVLTLPAYDSLRSYNTTVERVKSIQLPDKGLEGQGNLSNEFGILIEHLLADDSRALKQNRSQRDNPLPPSTKLQVLLMMWNSLFSDLQISLPDDINIEATKDSFAFHVSQMSDGEKVALFLISHVLLCPENGFVIVDEPEMYLHPTIHKKLWDKLESERSDAIFIYLTHDLEFASSRMNAKKLWLKSFRYPDEFELEEIPKNEIPQTLLMELLGSRQDILFCEGEIGSLDEQIYNTLFPSYTIKPVGGCLSVIDFTKAFNKLPMSTRKAIGIIDGDYISQKRLESLQQESIFPLRVPDVENLLLDESMLLRMTEELSLDVGMVDKIKQDILKKLAKEKETEIAKFVSAKVEHHFKDRNVSSGKNLEILKSNYKDFTNEVTIDQWAQERKEQIDNVLSDMDYLGAIQIFKNKGLSSIMNTGFGIRDFTQRAIDLLRRNGNLQTELRNYFPTVPTSPES